MSQDISRRPRKPQRPPSGYLSEGEQAEHLGIDVRTLRRWRALGKGPDVTRLGRLVCYAPEAGSRWLEAAEKPVALPLPRARAHKPRLKPPAVPRQARLAAAD